jgi:hypothetical protein
MVMRLSEKEQKEINLSSTQQEQMQLFVLMKLVSGSVSLVSARLRIPNIIAQLEK